MPGDWSRVSIDYLDGQFYYDAKELLDKLPDNWVVTESSRTMQRSNKLYINYKLNGGPRAAPGGISAHNYGMAIDVALDGNPIRPGLQAIWDVKNPAWGRLVAAIWKHPRLRSGKWFHDWPHIERYKWKDFVAWRKNYEDNVRKLVHDYPALQKHLPKVA